MSDLSNSVYTYYQQNFELLPFEKQFHFTSRLYLWSGDAWAKSQLAILKPDFTQGSPDAALRSVVQAAQAPPLYPANAADLRQPFDERYPTLKQYTALLFRSLFLQTTYGIDAQTALRKLVSTEELAQLYAALSIDQAALAVLSTRAVNFMYLFQKTYLQAANQPDPQLYIHAAAHYDVTDPIQLQLYIYLYTHCIIAESLFYARKPTRFLPHYQTMIVRLEALITEHFTDINLDNKFEFLVCCRLLDYTSHLQQQIQHEAQQSLAESSTFVIDKHNNNPQTAKQDLAGSEHRNVLLIMSELAYTGRLSGQDID